MKISHHGPNLELPSIIVVGLGGNTREFLDLIESQFSVMAILSDSPEHGPLFRTLPVLPLSTARHFDSSHFLFLIGSEKSYLKREDMISALGIQKNKFARIIHPTCILPPDGFIGHGTILSSGVTITSNVRIGDNVTILPNSVIHHDVVFGDYSIIGSNVTIAGDVHIGESCYIGSASSVRNGVRIGAGALIGMAANVLSDVEPGAVMVGNPARRL